MKIAVDAFGGDNAPLEIIKGAALAQKEYGVGIILTGDEKIINKCICDNGLEFNDLEIIHTEDVISMHDKPTSILKAHKECSMAVALNAVADGRADAFVSAGSTGAVVAGGTFIIKRIKGIKRPALASMIPGLERDYMLMDMGANAECRPEMLLQFGIMAHAYLEAVEGIEYPEIALLNIGTEETKGGELQLEAYKLLEKTHINFMGNVEAREVPRGVADAIITDGFTGNIVLKLLEGTFKTVFKMLKRVFFKNFITKVATLCLKGGLNDLKKQLDSSEIGGAMLMGVQKPVVKAHGNSDAKAIKNAINQARQLVDANIVAAIESNLSGLPEE